jgi:hypothetical protein
MSAADWELIVRQVDIETIAAEKKHPLWPDDLIHGVAIVCEESGEAIRAALQCQYEGGEIDDVRRELVQTAATCFRMLAWIDKKRLEATNGRG